MANYKRDSYGQLSPTNYNFELWKSAQEVIFNHAKKGRIEKAIDTIEFDRKKRASGYAVHHEIYDILPSPFKVLLCVRETEGTRYGVRTVSKKYFIITKTKVIETNKAIAAKAAKQAGCELGCSFPVLEGKKPLAVNRACPEGIAYKKVAVCQETGELISIYDGSSWALGIERHDKAMQNHNGGLYVFELASEAERYTLEREGHEHVIVKCLVSGNYCRYGRKLAFSNVTPVEIIKD